MRFKIGEQVKVYISRESKVYLWQDRPGVIPVICKIIGYNGDSYRIAFKSKPPYAEYSYNETANYHFVVTAILSSAVYEI